jgi:hypothetical protein
MGHMKQTRWRVVSGEGIATVIEKSYTHLARSLMVARVDILGLQVILWAAS